jgi:hypothetical protein
VIDLDLDESAPSRIDVVVDTPLRVNVEFLFRRPDDARWTTFYASKVGEDVSSQIVSTSLDALPAGTLLLFTFVFSGAQKTSFRLALGFRQRDAAVGAPVELTGSTGPKMAAYREVEVRVA